MKQIINIEFLVEIEDCIKDGLDFIPFNNIEEYYYDLACKIPYEDLLIKLIYYRKNFITIDEIKYFDDLIKYYNCTKEELRDRIKAVYKINKYRTKEFNKELKKTLK